MFDSRVAEQEIEDFNAEVMELEGERMEQANRDWQEAIAMQENEFVPDDADGFYNGCEDEEASANQFEEIATERQLQTSKELISEI